MLASPAPRQPLCWEWRPDARPTGGLIAVFCGVATLCRWPELAILSTLLSLRQSNSADILPPPGFRAWGTVMRINRLMLTQTVIAMSVALGVWYLQKRVGGPVGGMIPGVLGFCLGWFITPALLEDIDRVRGWLLQTAGWEGAAAEVICQGASPFLD